MDNRQVYRPDATVRRLLDTINNPQELKKLPPEFLPQLAKEIREKIISTVAKTGGHLAPSLGVVELSIALHYVFDCPRDKIVWDVGTRPMPTNCSPGARTGFTPCGSTAASAASPSAVRAATTPLTPGTAPPPFPRPWGSPAPAA